MDLVYAQQLQASMMICKFDVIIFGNSEKNKCVRIAEVRKEMWRDSEWRGRGNKERGNNTQTRLVGESQSSKKSENCNRINIFVHKITSCFITPISFNLCFLGISHGL